MLKRLFNFNRAFISKSTLGLHSGCKNLQEQLKFAEVIDDNYREFADKCNVNLHNIVLEVGTEHQMRFNTTWLRDSCASYSHQSSRQRLFNAKDYNKELFTIKQVQIARKSSLATSYDSEFINHLPYCKINADDDEKIVKIVWADDHESLYKLDWLKAIDNMYTSPMLKLGNEKPPRTMFEYPRDDFYSVQQRKEEYLLTHWDVPTIARDLKPVDYNDLLDGFKATIKSNDEGRSVITHHNIHDITSKRLTAMTSLCGQLVKFGLAKIVNVPQEPGQVLTVARSLAYERPTGYGVSFDVVVEATEERNLAYSSLEFDLHSDLTYREMSPGVQLLHCIRNSNEGGLSYFSDAFKAAKELEQINPTFFEVLLQFPCTFVVRDPYRDVKFRRHQPMISLNTRGQLEQIYYSPFMLPPVGHPDDVKLFYLAYDKFTQLLHSKKNKLITKMDSGDLFIFHNRRVLHGRSAYDAASSQRFLQGCYMDWDEIECLHEKLSSVCNVRNN